MNMIPKSKYVGETAVLKFINGGTVAGLHNYLPAKGFENPTELSYYFERKVPLNGNGHNAILGINVRDTREIISFMYVPGDWANNMRITERDDLEATLTRELAGSIRNHVGDMLYAAWRLNTTQ